MMGGMSGLRNTFRIPLRTNDPLVRPDGKDDVFSQKFVVSDFIDVRKKNRYKPYRWVEVQ